MFKVWAKCKLLLWEYVENFGILDSISKHFNQVTMLWTQSLISALLEFLMLCRWTGWEFILHGLAWPQNKAKTNSFFTCFLGPVLIAWSKHLAVTQRDQLSLRKTYDFFTYLYSSNLFHCHSKPVEFVVLLWPSIQYSACEIIFISVFMPS